MGSGCHQLGKFSQRDDGQTYHFEAVVFVFVLEVSCGIYCITDLFLWNLKSFSGNQEGTV